MVNLRKRKPKERRRQTLCDKCDNNFVWKIFVPNFTFLETHLSFVKAQNTVLVVKITTKLASDNPLTFVSHKRFADIFFLPPFCVSSLI